MRRRSSILTEHELEIMKIVWLHDTSTVRDVYEALLEKRKVAYTTVMTMMKVLEQKKYLKKSQAERAYVYRPAQIRSEEHTSELQSFRHLVCRLFFVNDTATTEIYTLSLHDALPISMMKVLEQKKYLKKSQAERAYVYRPAQI